MKYCLNCDWHANPADDSNRSPSRKAIDHHVETGHTIDSSDGAVPLIVAEELDTQLARE